MAEFIRARSDEQKALRMGEIKAAADAQFAARPYHEITLTTIADELSWSRANLYKYVTTKEEIFLALTGDKYTTYAEDLLAAFPEDAGLSPAEAAARWAATIEAHQDWFKLHSILLTIIETNVSAESLKGYKSIYYRYCDVFKERFPRAIGLPAEHVENLLLAISSYATNLICACGNSPVVKQVLAELGHSHDDTDVNADLTDYITMCLEHWGA